MIRPTPVSPSAASGSISTVLGSLRVRDVARRRKHSPWVLDGSRTVTADLPPMVTVVPARIDWLEALTEGDDVFTARFGIPVAADWVGFPDALGPVLDDARRHPNDPWGTHLFFDATDGALVGIGGFKRAPRDGVVEIGYAVAPTRRGRRIATSAVAILVKRARAAAVTTVCAHTIADENASTAVLRKAGFRCVAEVPDAELGAIWRWDLQLRPTPRPTA